MTTRYYKKLWDWELKGEDNADDSRRITGRSWLAGSSSVTVTLPKHLAEKHNIVEPCTVVFEDHPKGILIRRLKF